MIATKSSTLTPYQIRYRRTRVALADIAVGMTIKHGHRWNEVTYLGEVENNSDGSPFRRYVQTRVEGGRNAGEELEGWLYYSAYEVKPCAAILRPGDVIMINRNRVTVTQVGPMAAPLSGHLELSGNYQAPGKVRRTGVTYRFNATTQVKVVEWAAAPSEES